MKKCECNSGFKEYQSLYGIYLKCNECFSIFIKNKKKYNFINFLIKKKVILKSFKNKNTQFLYYLKKISNIDHSIKIKKSNKVLFIEKLIKNIKKKNIKILDISGGPGVDANILKQHNKIKLINVTEYNKRIINFAKKKLKIKFFFLDFDQIENNNVIGKYDIVIIWYSIYYCRDLRKLIDLLNKITKKKSYVIVASNEPNFACVTKFLLTEGYPPHSFWSQKYLLNYFEEKKYLKFLKKKIYNNNFIYYYFLKRFFDKKLYYFFCICLSIYYVFINLLQSKKVHKELNLKDYIYVFKKI